MEWMKVHCIILLTYTRAYRCLVMRPAKGESIRDNELRAILVDNLPPDCQLVVSYLLVPDYLYRKLISYRHYLTAVILEPSSTSITEPKPNVRPSPKSWKS